MHCTSPQLLKTHRCRARSLFLYIYIGRDAIKIVTSMVTAVAAGAPLSAILLLGRMSEPLVAIGAAYPKLAGDATSAVERMIHSGAFDADRLPQVTRQLREQRL